MDEKIILAIRDEVEKRVDQRESIYWKFGGLFAIVVTLFFAVLWKAQLSEVRTQIAKELAEQKVIEARDRILAMASESEVANQRVKDVSASMNTNYQDFVERLTQIKQQDNIVLKNDLSKLFVTQTGTNFDGQKLVLDYEPIPYSIKIYSPQILVPCLLMENWGYLNGKSFIFTNEGVGHVANTLRDGTARIDYVRKSLQ